MEILLNKNILCIADMNKFYTFAPAFKSDKSSTTNLIF